jgi:DeoR/GlpR family transcriptional regulator of sugar metabolism
MMRAVLDSAAEVTLLVDSSKFEATAMYRIAPLARLHRIVTDDALPAADRERIEAAGVELITVPADEDPAPG